MHDLLRPSGILLIETAMATIAHEKPIFECASDIFDTSYKQGKGGVRMVGLSNYLLPNPQAMLNLAHMYDFSYEMLGGTYGREYPHRAMFRFTKV